MVIRLHVQASGVETDQESIGEDVLLSFEMMPVLSSSV